uniref:HMG box domain-containing protein n=1 Tax=Megaselia scalaris TaxID=36166 RepID=T1GVT5_MEGSC
MPAFPSLQRLVKHVREVHLSKGGRHVHTGERSKNFVLSKRVQMMHGTPMPAQNAVPSQMPHQLSPPPVQYQQPQIVYAAPPPEPMFVTVPPQPQRANKPMKKPLTGYNLYSSDVRKSICLTNPEATFGDISRLVGTEWKNLPQDQKQLWEDRASKINEENKDLIVTGGQDSTPSTNHSSSTDNYSMVFECAWNKCDYQFEDAADCLEHCIQDENGHVQNTFVDKEHELV